MFKHGWVRPNKLFHAVTVNIFCLHLGECFVLYRTESFACQGTICYGLVTDHLIAASQVIRNSVNAVDDNITVNW
jgi:hypothetical protein